MKKSTLTLLALTIAFFCYSQDKEVRDTDDFHSISVSIPAEVIITKGNTHTLTLEGDADDLEKIETEVSGGVLSLKNEDDWWGNTDIHHVKVYITMPTLNAVALAGSGTIKSAESFQTNDFDVDISGSGKIDLNIHSQETEINISGSGKIFLTGTSNDLEINISGSGDVESKEFKVASADIQIMGSGNCTVNVTDELESTIMGSGDVYYVGEPKHLSNNSMGSGKLKKI